MHWKRIEQWCLESALVKKNDNIDKYVQEATQTTQQDCWLSVRIFHDNIIIANVGVSDDGEYKNNIIA